MFTNACVCSIKHSFPIYIVVITIFIFIIMIIIIFLLGIENIHTNVSTDNLGMVGLRLNFSQTLYSFRACRNVCNERDAFLQCWNTKSYKVPSFLDCQGPAEVLAAVISSRTLTLLTASCAHNSPDAPSAIKSFGISSFVLAVSCYLISFMIRTTFCNSSLTITTSNWMSLMD